MELIRKTIPYCDLTMGHTTVYEESTDAIVPDSFPDIARIVYAEGVVSVKDESPQNDRVLVSGIVNAVVLYQPEGEEGLRRLEVPLSFAHIEEGRGVTTDSICFTRCQAAAVEARPVNSRKVGVTARLCLDTAVYDKKNFSVTEEIKGSDETPLEVLYKTDMVTLPIDALAREFTILDDIELPGGEGLELLTASCSIKQTECRSMPGKLLLRGEAVVHGLALDETGTFQTINQPVAFSQVVEMSDLDEGAPVTIRLAVRNLDCMLGDTGVLSVGIGAKVLVLREQSYTIKTVSDLYQTKHELNVQARQARLAAQSAAGSWTGEGAETLPLGMKVSQYISARGVCTAVQPEESNGLRLNVEVKVLYLDDKGVPWSVGRMLSVPIKSAMHLEQVRPEDVQIQVTAIPISEDSVSLRVSASGMLIKDIDSVYNDVTAVEVSEIERQSMGNTTMVLRYAEEGERLWDIAKRYATTVSAIRDANGLADEQQAVSAQMLLIPIQER